MPLLSWSSAFSIGIGPLDREHRELFAAINDLQAAVESAQEPAVTTAMLRRVAVDTVAHFLDEERMMSATKYPGLVLHAMKHQHLISQLNAFLGRYSREDAIMNIYSLNFLRDWCTTHIQTEDRNFGFWLNEHGKY